jgi:hypothetical protein
MSQGHPSASTEGVWWRSAPDCFTLDAPGLAHYQVDHGRMTRSDPAPGAGDDVTRLLAHGLPQAACWAQRGYLALHAAAVATTAGAVALAGPSGMGKSVLAAALARRGFPLLSDEMLPVWLDPGGVLMAQPLEAEALLWARAARQLGWDPAALERARPGLERYWAPLPLAASPQPLVGVYLLGIHNQPDVKLERLGGQARVLGVMRAAFNRVLAEAPEQRRQLLLRLAALPRAVRVARLWRPEQGWSVDEMLAALERDGAL